MFTVLSESQSLEINTLLINCCYIQLSICIHMYIHIYIYMAVSVLLVSSVFPIKGPPGYSFNTRYTEGVIESTPVYADGPYWNAKQKETAI